VFVAARERNAELARSGHITCVVGAEAVLGDELCNLIAKPVVNSRAEFCDRPEAFSEPCCGVLVSLAPDGDVRGLVQRQVERC
jgi:hypothetical protein